MIIDCHNHVLATALPPGHDLFVREMRAPGHRRAGRLPAYRATTDEGWSEKETLSQMAEWEPRWRGEDGR